MVSAPKLLMRSDVSEGPKSIVTPPEWIVKLETARVPMSPAVVPGRTVPPSTLTVPARPVVEPLPFPPSVPPMTWVMFAASSEPVTASKPPLMVAPPVNVLFPPRVSEPLETVRAVVEKPPGNVS